MNSSEWANGGRVEEGMVWRKYRSEETCKKNDLKGYTNWKHGTDLTCAGATEKLEVATTDNKDVTLRDARSNRNHARSSCVVTAAAIRKDTGYLHMSRSCCDLSLLWVIGSLPCSTRNCATSTCPFFDAKCEGVDPYLFWAVGFVPCSTRNCTTSTCPFNDAKCKGVVPFSS